ncbi:MAG: hypothetical protein ACRD15_04035 [Vicinamibacterales bacterium]
MDDEIVLVSSTDSDEEVAAALAGNPVDQASKPVKHPEGAAEQRTSELVDHPIEVPRAVPPPKLDETNADGTPMFGNYEDWMAAHAQWTVDEAERRLIVREAATRHQHALNARTEEYKKSHAPDFDAVIGQARDTVQDLIDEIGPHALNIIDGFTAVDAENGPAVVYHLAQHPDEMERIARLHPRQQIAALAKIDARLGADPKQAVRRAAPTPPPRAAARTADPYVTESAEDDGEGYAAFKARRNKEERETRARR